jgi:S-phase kinase-associated protein 1
MLSQLVKETLEGEEDDEEEDEEDNENDGKQRFIPEIPLPNVSSMILNKVMEYCQHYIEIETMTPIVTPLKSIKLDEMVQGWYVDYVKVDKQVLFDLVGAANFMDVKPLLDLTCLAVSILIKGKSAMELRDMFHISHELSPEEEIQIQRENQNHTNHTTTNE